MVHEQNATESETGWAGETTTPGTPRRSPLFPWGIFVVVLVGAYLVARSWSGVTGPAGDNHPGVGNPIIFLNLQSLDAPEEYLSLADLSGQVVLLNFWGTWCPPCRLELPHIAALEEKYRGHENFRLLAVSCGLGDENPAELQRDTLEYLKKVNLQLPTYSDPDGQTRSAVHLTVGFEGYPTTLLLDPHGIVRGIWSGYTPGYEQQMDRMVGELLESDSGS